jgi:hypothetical protein
MSTSAYNEKKKPIEKKSKTEELINKAFDQDIVASLTYVGEQIDLKNFFDKAAKLAQDIYPKSASYYCENKGGKINLEISERRKSITGKEYVTYKTLQDVAFLDLFNILIDTKWFQEKIPFKDKNVKLFISYARKLLGSKSEKVLIDKKAAKKFSEILRDFVKINELTIQPSFKLNNYYTSGMDKSDLLVNLLQTIIARLYLEQN